MILWHIYHARITERKIIYEWYYRKQNRHNDFDDLLESLIEPENKVQLATIGKSRVKATSTNPVEEYKYSGIELYPSVFKEIMLKLYLSKQFTRQEAIEETKKTYITWRGM